MPKIPYATGVLLNGVLWTVLGNKPLQDVLGFLPAFFDENSQLSAYEQLTLEYPAKPFEGFTINRHDTAAMHAWTLDYPDDPPMKATAFCFFHDEILLLFEDDLLAIIQQNEDFLVINIKDIKV